MGMSSNQQNDDEVMSDINITPFVDVVLVLLVIFMVTTPMMIKEAMEIKLPKASEGNKIDTSLLALAINKNGQVLLKGQLISLDELYNEAQILKTESPDIKAIISADKESQHKHLIDVIDTIKKAGVINFAFEVEKPAP